MLQNHATFSTGKVGQAFSFNGIDDFVLAPTAGLPTGNSDRTLELWVKIDDLQDQVAPMAFFAGYGTNDPWGEKYILGATSGGTLFFSQSGDQIWGPVLSTGVWYHVAVTNIGDQATLYLNGAAVGSKSVPGWINTPTGTQFYMGWRDIYTRLKGSVDEVSVYNRALSAGEIQAIYNAGIAGKCKVIDACYFDTFTETDGPASGWTPVGDPALATWTVESGEYSADVEPDYYVTYSFLNGSAPWTDYKVEVSVLPMEGNWRAALIVRANTNYGIGGYDYYQIHSYPAGLRISKLVDGGMVSSGDEKMWDFYAAGFSIPFDKWHTLGVEAIGNQLKFYYNGQPVISVTDNGLGGYPAFLSGMIGLRAWGHSSTNIVHFDNFVVCPPDNQGPITSNLLATPNPLAAGSIITLTATVDDSTTGSSHIASAEYSFDGTNWNPMAAADGSFNGETENVTATIGPFSTQGVYEVCVRGTDAASKTGEAACTLLAVYDPTAGFVTGGGWINSPQGAYIADLSLTGKATFGFVSKYQKGANVPTGQTEFQFKVADLNFKSTSYEWLVVAGARAQYKGSGTINGTGNYGFMLTAIDGQITGGGGIDKFRIKIWDKASGSLVYDNQLGAEVTADPTTALGGGSIVIHK